MSLLAGLLLASVLFCSVVLLEDTTLYGNSILLSASGISSHKSLNLTLGNSTYLMINNETGNLEMLFIDNANSDRIFKLINSESDNDTDNENGIIKLLKDFAVPISVAIIGGITASWNFFQARWNGRYLQKLILEELGEFEPIDIEEPIDTEEPPIGRDKIHGNLQSHMNKQFIHKKILDNPTENKEFIFNTNHHLIYLTTQLWDAFESNDGEEFLKYFCYISQQRKFKIRKYRFYKKYDRKGKIEKAYKKWIKLVTKDNHAKNSKDIKLPEKCKFKSENIEDTFSLKGDCAHQSTL